MQNFGGNSDQLLGQQTQPLSSPIPESPEQEIQETPNDESIEASKNIDSYSKTLKNYAESFSEEELSSLAKKIKEGYENDLNSMSEFFETRKKYIELIEMKYKPKDYPWPNAANIMLPTIMTAIFNFQSRSGPALLPPFNILESIPTSASPVVTEKAKRIQKHLNYQITYQMSEFKKSFDTGLFLLAQDGTQFRKVYWDSKLNRPVSEYVLPTDFIIDFKTRSLEESYRYTQHIYKHPDEIVDMMDQGIYKHYDNFDRPSSITNDNVPLESTNQDSYIGLRVLLESHTYVDLEGDGKMVPAIVTMDKDTNRILRIVDRRNPYTFKTMQYFIPYAFIPNPNSLFGYGFGLLLLGPTVTMNTAVNQMLDAGHLANVGGGVIKKTAQMSRGNLPVRPGEFLEVESRDDDIKKTLMQFQWPGPNHELLSLVEFLQGYVDRLTTVTELFTGSVPRSDTAASSTMAALEQGAKSFTAIQIRIANQMIQEFQLIADLDSMHLGEYVEFYPNDGSGNVSKDGIYRADYEDNDYRIMLVTDPTVISKQQQMANAEYIAQVIATNPFLAQDPTALKISMRKRLEAINCEPAIIESLSMAMDQAVAQQQQQMQMQQQQMQQQQEMQMQQAHTENLRAQADHAKGGEALKKAHGIGMLDAQIAAHPESQQPVKQ